MFEFEPTLPFDNMLTVQVFDWDMMSGDDLIGQTEIDIENRFYSKHRASCGLQKDYITLVISTIYATIIYQESSDIFRPDQSTLI